MTGLVALALRRSLPVALWLPHFLLVLLACTRGFQPPALVSEEGRDALLSGAFARQGVWAVFWIFAAPACLLRTAAGLRRWRRHDADWLAASPAGRLAPLVAAWVGGVLAASGLLLVTALGAELAARVPGAPEPLRWAGNPAHPTKALFPGDPPLRWTVEDLDLAELAPGTRLRFRPTVVLGAGQAVTASFSFASTNAPDAGRSVERRVSGPTALELLAPPERSGKAQLTVERPEAGAVLFLPPRSVELLVPARWRALASVELAGRAILLLAAGSALALGLGAWLRPSLAGLTVLALFLASWLWLGAGTVPGADLPSAWRMVGHGLVPPRVPAASLAGAFTLVAVGLALAERGARTRGGVP